jgi:hypothetical protein
MCAVCVLALCTILSCPVMLLLVFAGENALRSSGVPYTIVRPVGLSNAPGGQSELIVGQGDHPLRGRAQISRADVARVCVEALRYGVSGVQPLTVHASPCVPTSCMLSVYHKRLPAAAVTLHITAHDSMNGCVSYAMLACRVHQAAPLSYPPSPQLQGRGSSLRSSSRPCSLTSSLTLLERALRVVACLTVPSSSWLNQAPYS